jgi:hypothetical protein
MDPRQHRTAGDGRFLLPLLFRLEVTTVGLVPEFSHVQHQHLHALILPGEALAVYI